MNEPKGFETTSLEGLTKAFWEQTDADVKDKQKYLKTKDFLEESKGGLGIKAFTWSSYEFSEYDNKPTMEWTILIRTGPLKGQQKVLTLYGSKAFEIARELGRDFEKWKGQTMDATVVPGMNGKDRLLLKKRVELE